MEATDKAGFVVLPGDPPTVVMIDGDHGASREFLACGHCMEPLVSPGDWLQVEPAVRVSKGDIAVFRSRNRLLAHRVVRVGDGIFWAAGDRMNEEDGPVSLSELIGKVGWVREPDGQRRPVEQSAMQGLRLFINKVLRGLRSFDPLKNTVRSMLRLAGPVWVQAAGLMNVTCTDHAQVVAAELISDGLIDSTQVQKIEESFKENSMFVLRARVPGIGIMGGAVLRIPKRHDGRDCASVVLPWTRWLAMSAPVGTALLTASTRLARDAGLACLDIEFDTDNTFGYILQVLLSRAVGWHEVGQDSGSGLRMFHSIL